VVRAAIDKLAANLARRRQNRPRDPLLPDFAASSRLYMRMLMSFLAASFAPEKLYAGRASKARRSSRRDDIEPRGGAISRHPRSASPGTGCWLTVGRVRLRAQWRETVPRLSTR